MNIILTGATGGLGLAIIEQFIPEKDVNLLVIGRDKKKLEEVVSKYQKSFKGRLLSLSCDFCDLDQIGNLCNDINNLLQDKIDILINNAGIAYHCSAMDIKKKEVVEVFNVNVISQIVFTSSLLPFFRLKANSKIIFISSILGSSSMDDTSVYTSSKHAINGFAKVLRGELIEKNISVSIVEPGAIETDFIKTTNNKKTLNKFEKRLLERLNPNILADWIVKVLKSDNNTCPEIIRITPLHQYLQ